VLWLFVIVLLTLQLVGCGGPTPLPSEPPVPPQPAASSTAMVTVSRVTDGDTVELSDGRKVRILGIDAPESVKPGAPVDCFGPEASAFATATLLNKQVTVTGDPTQDEVDRYGRTLAYVNLADGRDYSVLAADAGMARSYVYNGRPVQRFPAILRAERAAKDAGRGLWRGCAPTPPVTSSRVPTTTPAPVKPPTTTRKPAPTPAPPRGPFANCAAARAAGAAPVHRGDPGYAPRLDRDNDGIGCE
jgi:micrococcal nuclease